VLLSLIPLLTGFELPRKEDRPGTPLQHRHLATDCVLGLLRGPHPLGIDFPPQGEALLILRLGPGKPRPGRKRGVGNRLQVPRAMRVPGEARCAD